MAATKRAMVLDELSVSIDGKGCVEVMGESATTSSMNCPSGAARVEVPCFPLGLAPFQLRCGGTEAPAQSGARWQRLGEQGAPR